MAQSLTDRKRFSRGTEIRGASVFARIVRAPLPSVKRYDGSPAARYLGDLAVDPEHRTWRRDCFDS
jgi:hypothetical protein